MSTDTLERLELAIARMSELLDTGRWPTGVRLSPQERGTVEWNLELAKRERTARRNAERRRARA